MKRVNSRNKPFPWSTSRSEAKASGAARYFTGLPCKYGHVAKRNTRDGGCTECNKVNALDYHYANQEACNVRQLERYHENRSTRLLGMREWKAANKDKMREINARRDPVDQRRRAKARRAKKKAALGSHSIAEIRALLVEQNGRCFYCAEVMDVVEEDHFIPLSKGGSDFIDNIRLSCPTCNRKKKDAMPWDFISRMLTEKERRSFKVVL